MTKQISIIVFLLIACSLPICAAETANPVSFQYWVDNNFDSRVTVSVSSENRRIKIPEEYFYNLSNGGHRLYTRVKDSYGRWGQIRNDEFYFYNAGIKDDSTATALKAYRYGFNKGDMHKILITPSSNINEKINVNLPSVSSQSFDRNNLLSTCSFRFEDTSTGAGKASMTRDVLYNFVMQYQNDNGVWSDLSSSIVTKPYTLMRDIFTVALGGNVVISAKPVGGVYEVVKFVIPSDDDFSIRASEGCEMTIFDASGVPYVDYVSASNIVESYRGRFNANTYYGVIYNSLKNLSNPSDGLTFSLQNICKRPVISRSENNANAFITTETAGATIYYTIDGTNPTEKNGTVYSGEFAIPHNCLIKAVAVMDGYGISYIDSMEVADLAASVPVATFNEGVLTLECPTPNSTIYYKIGDDTEGVFRKYVEPLSLEDNSTVYFYAKADNFLQSSNGSYSPNGYFKCKKPEFAFDGRELTITSTPDAQIYYCVTATKELPDNPEWIPVFGSVHLSDTLYVSAYASTAKLGNSEINQYEVPAVFRGNYDTYNNCNAIVKIPGMLASALQWCDKENAEIYNMWVGGNINLDDIATIKSISTLEELYLENAILEGGALPDEAFAGLENLYGFASPSNLTSAGARILDGCDNLGGINWCSNINVPDDILGGKEYANLVLFVNSADQANASVFKNIVVNGSIDKITLVDSEERACFYAPRDFYVKEMSYTRAFTQPTLLTGECQGWEAICLPFRPSEFTHETNGACIPFEYLNDDSTQKPFWLCRFGYNGFSSYGYMESCRPCIISMPNNEEYADEYILNGNITFLTRDNYVYRTYIWRENYNGHCFVSNFTNRTKDKSRSVINAHEEYNGYKMGSVFVPGLRAPKAFEPYFESIDENGMRTHLRAPEIGVGNSSTGINDIPMRLTDRDIYSQNGVLFINSTIERETNLYNVGGQLVRKLHLKQGINEITGLAKGIYMANKVKVIIR